MGTCEQCGTDLVKPARGRPQTRFCSKVCKEAARTAIKTAAIMAARVGRVCVQCNGPIPEAANLRAKTCSSPCGVAYMNRRRQEGKRAAWLASKPPCGKCGGDIPESRAAGSMYCSFRCKQNKQAERWRERSPGYMRSYLYGLTPERYAELLERQGGRCAICAAESAGGRGGWHVDHCHETQAVRGLLCHHCNIGIGQFRDRVDLLQAAIGYLTRD